MSNNSNEPKKKSFLSLLFAKCFGGKKTMSVFEEEQMQSPGRTIVKNFKSNKLAMTGLIVFLLMFLTAFIGPLIFKIDLSYSESTQLNVSPGYTLMKYPSALKGNVKEISVGPTFSVGVSNDGTLYTWGKTKITNTLNLANIPDEYQGLDYKRISAGFDHILGLTSDGKVVSWGNDRMKQVKIPAEVQKLNNIIDVIAGYQCSYALTEDGYVYMWGNDSLNDFKEKNDYQGQIEKIAVTGDACIALTYDGQVVYLGKQTNAYSSIPELIGKVVDISATASTFAAVTEDGTVKVWGNITHNEDQIPETSSKIVSIKGGRYHYTAIKEDGDLIAWGDDTFKQTQVPSSVNKGEVSELYTGYYQNYAVMSDGSIKTWGLKGYLLGTDDLGRDILVRLINGAKMTMTIGAVSVIISTCLGVIIGGISGFFGGKVDLLLQRLTEIVSSLPFIPFCMILSSLIGNKISENQRIALIMMILGLLSWPSLSRLVRAQVLAEREKEFVTAARAMGVKEFVIVFKHVVPNIVSVIIVSATLDFASCMLTESTLSYLGFGVSPPQPTWGNMLYGSNNSIVIQSYWWRWVYASIALGVCTICINLVGDGLRDAMDPKSNKR